MSTKYITLLVPGKFNNRVCDKHITKYVLDYMGTSPAEKLKCIK